MFRSNVEVGPCSSTAVGINSFLKQMYAWLFVSLIVASVSAYTGMQTALVHSPGISIILAIIGFVPLIYTGHEALKNPTLGIIGLIAFSVIDGLSLSCVLAMYTSASITEALLSSSAIFGGMSLIGLTTHKDLSHIGTQLFGALIGLIVASIISIFFANSLILVLINIVGVIIFSGLSMFDTWKMVKLYQSYDGQVSTRGLAILGALNLYIDFENIFLDILNLINNNKN